MSDKFLQTNSCFALGEVSPDWSGRGDSKTAAYALSKLRNMDILPSGGLRRRAGTSLVAQIPATSERLISFKTNNGDELLVAICHQLLKVFSNGVQLEEIRAPWTSDQIQDIQFVQFDDSIIFVQSNHIPHILNNTYGYWELEIFFFTMTNGFIDWPWHSFPNSKPFTLTDTYTGSPLQATANSTSANWTPDSIGSKLLFNGMEWEITQYFSPTSVRMISGHNVLIPTGRITNYVESAFSTRRGWPRSVTIFQNRLIFAGNNALPNHIWMSRTGNFYNFNVGTAQDNEAIVTRLMSTTGHSITSAMSGENLEILTDRGEWSIKGAPITPRQFTIRQHTNIGSVSSPRIMPTRIDNSTIFVSRSGKELRELKLDNLNDSYSTTDLASLSPHFMNTPISMTYHTESKRLFVVQSNGTIAVLTKDENLEILGWSLYETNGKWKSVAVAHGKLYALVDRNGVCTIEVFDETKATDGANGFAFEHSAASMPLFADGTPARKIRITKLKANVQNSGENFTKLCGASAEIIIPGGAQFSGIASINALGTSNDMAAPVWEIIGTEPLTLLSITIEGRITL